MIGDHWTEDTSQLWKYAEQLEEQHRPRLALDKACLRLLCPRPDLSAAMRTTNGQRVAPLSAFNTFRKQGPNLSQEVVGGAMAMIVRPMQIKLMPVGADYELRNFCRQSSLLIDGVFAANRSTEVFSRAAKDAMWATVGAIKTRVDSKDEIRLERVDPLGLFWDMYEGDQPLTLIQVHAIPKRRLMAEYPEHAKEIKGLPTWYPQTIPGVDSYGLGKPDTVKVVEATAVRMGDTVGKIAVAVQGLVLDEGDYNDEQHDISVFRWDKDPRGFGGISLIRSVAPYHAQMVRYQRMYNEQLKGCVPIIWVQDDEETFKNISDLEYQIGRYSGANPPRIEIAGKVSADLLDAMDRCRRNCYGETGVSFSVTTGQKPVGLNSAPSQREWLETQNLRLQQGEQDWQQLHCDVASRAASKAATTYKSKAARVRAPGTEFLGEIKWPNLKEDQYQAVVSAASGLSLTISGKIEQTETLMELGVMDQEDVAASIDLPDTERKQELTGAPRNLAEMQIYKCLEVGEARVPSPIQDVQRALKISKLEYQLALQKEIYPLKNRQLLRRYIRRCESLLKTNPVATVLPAAPAGIAADPLAPAPDPTTSALAPPPPA